MSSFARCIFASLAFSLTITSIAQVNEQMFHPPTESISPIAFDPPGTPLPQPATPTANPRTLPSVAVIEFKDSSASWTQCSPSSAASTDCQENRAKKFIQDARTKAAASNLQLVVLTYVHGWHHNASEKSYNFRNFMQMIDCLNWGEDAFARTYPFLFDADHKIIGNNVSCVGVHAPANVRYIGLYVGWRGEDFAHPNVLNELPSLLSRHDAAGRMAEGELNNVLERLAKTAKTTSAPLPEPARFVVVGHSFGGLIVSRIASRMFRQAFDPSSPVAAEYCSVLTTETGHRGYADLMVAINAADSSIRIADLMRTLKMDQAKDPTFFCSNEGRTAVGLPRPLLVSIHTASDDATGAAGHAGLFLRRYDSHYPGREHLNLRTQYDTPNNSELAPTFGALMRDPINHLNYLHTLCYLDQDGNGDWICDRVNENIVRAKSVAYKDAGLSLPSDLKRGAYELVMAQCGGQDIDSQDTSESQSCDAEGLQRRDKLQQAMLKALSPYLAITEPRMYAQPTRLMNLYTRLDSGCKILGSQDSDDPRPACAPKLGAQPEWPDQQAGYKHPPVAPWSNTPVWEFNVPFHTIQEHNGFWNQEVITLISGIASTFDVLPLN